MNQDNFPTIQIIGNAEQRQTFFQWLEERDARLIEKAISQFIEQQEDPLAKHPEAAPAAYWAGLKAKANGGRYGARSFQKFCQDQGICRLSNGLYPKDAARRFLYG
jgi:hypothetical protein